MEGLGDVLVQIGVLAGGGAGVAAILSYIRNRRKDSMDGYSDLVGRLEVRCATLEKRCDDLEAKLKQERYDCAAELVKRDRRIDGLERELSQMGRSAVHLIKKLDE